MFLVRTLREEQKCFEFPIRHVMQSLNFMNLSRVSNPTKTGFN